MSTRCTGMFAACATSVTRRSRICFSVGLAVVSSATVSSHERVGNVRLAAGMTFELSARGLGDRALVDEDHGEHRRLMLFGDGLLERTDDVLDGRPGVLGDDDELLVAVALDGDRDAAALPDRRSNRLDRGLDVLWEQVTPTEDDHVLATPGDVQLSVVKKAEISGAEERSFAGVGQVRAERLASLLVAPPVSARDTRAAHPDLAHGAVADRCRTIGIDDANVFGRS